MLAIRIVRPKSCPTLKNLHFAVLIQKKVSFVNKQKNKYKFIMGCKLNFDTDIITLSLQGWWWFLFFMTFCITAICSLYHLDYCSIWHLHLNLTQQKEGCKIGCINLSGNKMVIECFALLPFYKPKNNKNLVLIILTKQWHVVRQIQT